MAKYLWNILAATCMIAAIGFVIAFLVGGYTPFIAVGAMWICIGCLFFVVGVLKRKPKKSEEKNQNQK
jgi:uncharacterized membrane protein